MKMVRGHGEARWFPSRHNFALFRLFAYLRLRSAKHEARDVILAIDRNQSNLETNLVAIWIVLTTTCCLTATFDSWLAALAVAILGTQVVMVASGVFIAPLFPGRGVRVNATVMMMMLAALAAYCTTRSTWVRFAGWQFFALLAMNAVAAAIMFLLRDSVARLEDAIGGASSAH
jgi:hypothetical protein